MAITSTAADVLLRTILSGATEARRGLEDVQKGVEGLGEATKKPKEAIRDLGEQTEQTTSNMVRFFREAAPLIGVSLAGVAAAIGSFLYNIGKEWSYVADQITIRTGRMDKSLKDFAAGVSDVSRNVPDNIQKVNQAFIALSRYIDETNPSFKRLVTDIVDLSRMIGGDAAANAKQFGQLLANWKVPAEEADRLLNGLFRVTQNTGVEFGQLVSQLTRFGPTFRSLGMNVEQAALALGSMSKDGDAAMRVVAGFNTLLDKLGTETVKVKQETNFWTGEIIKNRDATGQLIESKKTLTRALSADELQGALDKFIKRIVEAKTQQDATRIAGEHLAGTMAAAFANAVRAMAASGQDASKFFSDYQNGIQQTADLTENIGETISTQWNRIKAEIRLASEGVESSIKGIIQPILRGMTDALLDVITGWKSLAPNIKEAVNYVVGTVGGAGGLWLVATILGQVGTAVVGLATALGMGGPLVAAVTALTAFLGGAVAAWAAPIAAIAGTAYIIYAHWDDLVNFFTKILPEAVAQGWDEVKRFFEGPVMDTLKDLRTGFQNNWEEIVTGFAQLGNKVSEAFSGALTTIERFVDDAQNWLGTKFKERILDPLDSMIKSIARPWEWLYDHLVGNSVIPDMMNEIKFNFGRLDEIAVQPTSIAAVKIGQKWAEVNTNVFDPELQETQRLFRETFIDKLPDLTVKPIAAATETITRQMTEFISDLGNLMRDIQSVLSLAGIKSAWLKDLSDMIGAVSLLSKVVNNVGQVVTWSEKIFDILDGGKTLKEAFGEDSIITKAAEWLGITEAAPNLAEGGATGLTSLLPDFVDAVTSPSAIPVDIPSTIGGFDTGGGATIGGEGNWVKDLFSGSGYVDDAADWVDDLLSGGMGTDDVAGSAGADFLRDFVTGLGVDVGVDGLGTYAGEVGSGLAFDFAPETLASVAGESAASWIASMNPGALLIALTKIPQIIQMFTGVKPPDYGGTIKGTTSSELSQMRTRSEWTDAEGVNILEGDWDPEKEGAFNRLARAGGTAGEYLFDFLARSGGSDTPHPAVLAVLSGFDAILKNAGLRLAPSADLNISVSTEPSRKGYGYHVDFGMGDFVNGDSIDSILKNMFLRTLELGLVVPEASFATGTGGTIISSRTLIEVGEQGPEMVSVRPLAGGRAGGSGQVQFVMNGPVMFDDMTMNRFARELGRAIERQNSRLGLA